MSTDGDPVEDIAESLRSAGWSTRAGGAGPLLLSGDTPAEHPAYGVPVQSYEAFTCLDRPEVCAEFEKVAEGGEEDLFRGHLHALRLSVPPRPRTDDGAPVSLTLTGVPSV